MAQENNIFIEKHDGGYRILRGGRKQASPRRTDTQEKAIEFAKKNYEGAAIHVERVRDVETGSRDKWRAVD